MPELQFKRFSNPRKKRCNCCDRTRPLDLKVLMIEEDFLIGDFELCEPCAEALKHAGAEVKETVLQEWNFSKE